MPEVPEVEEVEEADIVGGAAVADVPLAAVVAADMPLAAAVDVARAVRHQLWRKG